MPMWESSSRNGITMSMVIGLEWCNGSVWGGIRSASTLVGWVWARFRKVELWKKGVSHMIFNKGTHCVNLWFYAKDFRWHNALYLVHSYELRPYESSVKYYIYLCTYVIIYNTYYLLFILWHAMFIFALGDYPLSVW